MQDDAQARAEMIEQQIRARGVADSRVLAALQAVPRHRFVDPAEARHAYDDYPLPIGLGQTISQPYIVALMSELLRLQGQERVLEVGTGSGYQAAVLSQLCQEVVSIERFPELAARAAGVLAELGYANVGVVVGDGSQGWPARAPYDAIVVTAAAPEVAQPWLEQLAEGGRLVVPIGERYGQTMVRLTKRGAETHREHFGAVAFVPLVGEHGWGEGGG